MHSPETRVNEQSTPSVVVSHYPITTNNMLTRESRIHAQKPFLPEFSNMLITQPHITPEGRSPTIWDHTHHHHHHHYHHHHAVVSERLELPVVPIVQGSPYPIRNFPRPEISKTISCPENGSALQGRSIRPIDRNNSLNTVFSPGLNRENPTSAGSPPSEEGTRHVERISLRKCCRLSKGTTILITTFIIIIISLICGFIIYAIRADNPPSDISTKTAVNSSAIVPRASLKYQTSQCGIFPIKYLPPELRSLNFYRTADISAAKNNDIQHTPTMLASHHTQNSSRNSSKFSNENNGRLLVDASMVKSRIFGGRDSSAKLFPWQVSLWVENKRPMCGGSVLLKSWILTAAHCTHDQPDETAWTAYMGMSKLSEKDNTEVQISRILKIIQHELYKNDKKYDYDISLMKLETPVSFTSSVQPICLPSSTDVDHEETRRCYISGWGSTDHLGEGDPPNALQYAEIDLIGDRTCRLEDGLDSLMTDRMICAGKQNGTSDACQGDSGGPLSCYNANKGIWILIGSVSWGITCGDHVHPGVYAKIPYFVDWIWSSIGKYEGWIPS